MKNKAAWKLNAGPYQRSERLECCSRVQKRDWPILSCYFSGSSPKLHFGLRRRSGNASFSTAKNWPSRASLVGDRNRTADSPKSGTENCALVLVIAARLKKFS